MQRAAGWLLAIGILVMTGCAAVDDSEESRVAEPMAGVPGETLGDAVLQEDTKMPVFMAAITKISNKDCPAEEFQLGDTKVLSQPKEVEGRAVYTSWRELWTVESCGESVDVEVTYMQHFLNGVSIHAK
jgi:hypothetical protein